VIITSAMSEPGGLFEAFGRLYESLLVAYHLQSTAYHPEDMDCIAQQTGTSTPHTRPGDPSPHTTALVC